MIPNKLYFRIGEVSDIVGVKPYVLRYWESEFPDIKPSKSKSGQRLYKRRDVEILLRIRQLLYEEKFTIDGARKRIKENGKNGSHAVEAVPVVSAEVEMQQKQVKEVVVEIKPKAPILPQRDHSAIRPGAIPLVESRKILMKIRKDLETMLKIVGRETSARRPTA